MVCCWCMYNAQILSFPFNLCTVPPGCRGAAAQAAQATQAAQAAQAAHAHRAAAHSPNVPRAGTNWGKCRCTGIDRTFLYLSTCNVDHGLGSPLVAPGVRSPRAVSPPETWFRCLQTHQDFDKDSCGRWSKH